MMAAFLPVNRRRRLPLATYQELTGAPIAGAFFYKILLARFRHAELPKLPP